MGGHTINIHRIDSKHNQAENPLALSIDWRTATQLSAHVFCFWLSWRQHVGKHIRQTQEKTRRPSRVLPFIGRCLLIQALLSLSKWSFSCFDSRFRLAPHASLRTSFVRFGLRGRGGLCALALGPGSKFSASHRETRPPVQPGQLEFCSTSKRIHANLWAHGTRSAFFVSFSGLHPGSSEFCTRHPVGHP